MTEQRVAALAAAAFTIAFLAGAIALGEVFGALGDADDVFIDHYASGGRRAGDIAGGSALVVAGIALMVLGVAVGRVLVGGLSASIATQALSAAGLVVAICGALFATTPLSMSFGGMFDDTGQFGGGHAAVLPQASTVVLLTVAYPLAALGAGATALAGRSAAVLPAWHFWVSLACAAVMPLAFFFAPILALPAWSAATSVALWRVRDRSS